MTKREKAMLSALIARFHLQREPFQKAIKEKEVLPQGIQPQFGSILSPLVWAENIHYSWFDSLFDGLPKYLFTPFLSEAEQKKEGARPAECLLPFLALLLKKRLMPKEIVEIEHLMPSKLLPLLDLTKEQRLKLIDLLGLFDLAIELRHVVEKKRLAHITSLFSKEERAMIDYFARSAMKWVPPRLGLESWDGKRESLDRLVHSRGLIRLGKALCDEEESFIWHLTHRFDVGRGELLIKWSKSESEKALIAYFKTEVINLMQRFHS